MKAVHDCTAAKGVEMPAPPAGGPPKGEKPANGEKGAGNPPPEGKDPHGPKLTDAQHAIIDACFAEQGLTPPKGHGPDGKGMGGRRLGGKPPEQKSPTETTK